MRVDGVAKVAELELAEKEKMKEKVDRILSHNPSVFINRSVDVLKDCARSSKGTCLFNSSL